MKSIVTEIVVGSAVDFHARPLPTDPHPHIWWFTPKQSALVLGSTQDLSVVNSTECLKRGVEIVKRRSGGGAVLLSSETTVWIDVVLPAMTVAVFPVLGPCWFGDTWLAPRSGGRQHQGVDIIAKSGTPLYAANNGRISRQSFDRVGSLGGNTITLTAADGTYFYYAHLSTFADGIAVGSEVVAGQVIGYVGNTGSSSTPHLHFEYHPYGGAAVNPYPPVKAIDGCKITTPPTTIPPTTTIAPKTTKAA